MRIQPSGKTTRIMEEAVDLLGDLPEDCFVFITGAHSKWLLELSKGFKEAGLTDIKFFTVAQIKNGCLRGRRGVLLVDDVWDLSPEEYLIVNEEQRILRYG